MVRSDAATVEQYLDELPDERRPDIEAVRRVILNNLPPGYDEVMRWGMITYEVPLERYPATYNGQPLQFAALAAQKNYNTLYLTNVAYTGGEDDFRRRYAATGKRFDFGKSCLRYRAADDIALDVIADTIAATPVDTYLADYEGARKG